MEDEKYRDILISCLSGPPKLWDDIKECLIASEPTVDLVRARTLLADMVRKGEVNRFPDYNRSKFLFSLRTG